ncbi:hypothetical protein D918_08845 [Trichuris suis]|nr:hypothetical protein D918_08845 [Trichuris suis]
MLYQTDWSLLCQGAALKYIPHIVSDVLSVFDQREFASVMANFIRNVPEDRLTKQKLMCLLDFVQSEMIKRPEPRSILLPVMLESVKFQIENNEELELCAQILTATMEVLFDKRLSKSANSGTLLFIMRVALRPVVQVIVRLIEANEQVILGQYVALLLSLLEELDACTYRSYISDFVTRTDLMDFITELLMLFRDLLSHPVFPVDWFQMTFVQNSIILKILCYAASTVKARFLHEKFDYQVCSNFFQTAVSFITHKQLQLENFPAKKRKSILEKFRDMRLTCGRELVRSMWFSMNQKNEFIPCLVGSILEVTLIPVEEVRKLTIPIFFDMMVTEFYLRASATLVSTPVVLRGNFSYRSAVVEFETEFITKLDQLIDAGSGDAKYADTFVRLDKVDVYEIDGVISFEQNMSHSKAGRYFYSMMQLCSSHTEPLREEGMRVTRTVELLIGRLLDFRAVRLYHNNINNRMSCTVSLLNFYYDIGHMDLYIKYLYKLYELHKQQENYVEAALTLALHADCLKWSDSPAKAQHLHSSFHSCRTQRDLKEALSLQMIELFDRGELWEKAIGVCQVLQREYEHSTFEYDKLSDLLARENVEDNATFVYRGDGYERLADFATRIQAEFPRANLLNSLDPPSDEIKSSGEQYLQINKVDPVCDEQMKRISGRIKDPHILWYHKCNEVQKFSFSRRISRRLSDCTSSSVDEQQENEFGLMWLERSILVTSCLFPGILRWFPVTSESHVDLSPVEVAVEAMTTAVKDLERLINDAELHRERSLKPLAAKLQGMLQPAVMGGIQNYEKVFFNESFTCRCDQKTLDLLDILKDRIAAQVPLLEKGVYLHAQLCSCEQREFHCLLVSCFKEYKSHVEQHYGARVSLLPENAVLDMPRAQSLQKQHSMDGYMFNDARSPHSSSLVNRKANSVRDWQGSTSTPWLLRSGMMTTLSGSSVPRRIHQKETASRRKAAATSEKEVTISRASTDSISSAQSTDGHSYVLPIVLTEKLTPLRPPRPDSNVSKGSSQNPSNLSSNRFTSSLERLNGARSSLLTFTNFDELSLTGDEEEPINSTPPPLPPRRDSGHVEVSAVISPLLSPMSPTCQRLPSMITVPRREKPLPPLPTKP